LCKRLGIRSEVHWLSNVRQRQNSTTRHTRDMMMSSLMVLRGRIRCDAFGIPTDDFDYVVDAMLIEGTIRAIDVADE